MPEAARIALHREAGRELARAGAPLSQIASHVLLGAVTGDAEAALSLRGAARDAAARAPGIAVALLPRADELLPPDHPERDGVLLELVVALLRTGQVAQAAKITEDVLARPHDADVDLPLRIAMIDALSILNRGQELIDLTESTLTENPDMPLADQALIMAQGSFGKTFSGDYAGGELTARRALALAERAGDPAMIVWSMTTMAVAVKTQGRYEEALDLTRTAVRLAFDGANDSARMRHPNFIHGMVLCDCDLMDDATVAFRKAATESVELESAWIVPDLHLVVAELRFLLGDWAEAEPEFEGGLTAARERGNLILMPRIHAYLALVAAARGDVRAAELALEPVASELTSTRPRFGAEFVAYAASMIAEASGRSADALEVLSRFWHHGVAHQNRYSHRSGQSSSPGVVAACSKSPGHARTAAPCSESSAGAPMRA